MSTHYPWKRFWCPVDKEWNLSDGFLFDPDSEYGKIYNPDIFPLEAIDSSHCVVMLGEQGIGKSEELRSRYKSTQIQTDASADKCLYVNLGQCTSRPDLNAEIFECTIYQSWLKGEVKDLYLFLDSLDENILHFGTVTKLLLQRLQECPKERLYLRVACRSGYWRREYEKELQKIWGTDIGSLHIVKLAPLRSSDVKLAVELNGVDAGGFFKELYSKRAVPFAIKPVTLEMLIRKYVQDGKLPKTQWKLYSEGCLLLSEEREALKSHGAQLTRRERVAIASRIAAISILSHKPLIWIGSGWDTLKAGIDLEDICTGYELAEGRKLEVRINNVHEVLSTGLFVNSGSDQISWAHQSYCEFLAAKYLIDHGIDVSRILNLITCFDVRGRRIIPQLSAVAAWLATMSEEVSKELIKINPDILLDSDIGTTDDAMRKALIESHLSALENNEITLERGISQKYEKLNYDGIESQLNLYILDNKIDSTVRREAIKIAEECKLVSLLPQLVKIALNSGEQVNVRIAAAAAIASIGDREAKLSLKPLMLGVDDPLDELKGYALEAVWSLDKNIDLILEKLSAPKRNNFHGSYYFFVAYTLPKTVEISDLPKLLDWATEQWVKNEAEGNYAFKGFI